MEKVGNSFPKPSPRAYTKVIREDHQRENLLFAGTVNGVYTSWDGGDQWTPLQLNLPKTPITDLKIAHDDLVVATQGRSFWILDDLEILRQLEPQASDDFKIYEVNPAYWAHWSSSMNSNSPTGKGTFEGVNRLGMVIYYELPQGESNEPIHLEIFDSQGTLVNEFSSIKEANFSSYEGGPSRKTLMQRKGLNRFVWDLRHEVARSPRYTLKAVIRGTRPSRNLYT